MKHLKDKIKQYPGTCAGIFLCLVAVILLSVSLVTAFIQAGEKILDITPATTVSGSITDLFIWKGSYTITIDYTSSSDDNTVEICPPNDSYKVIQSDILHLWTNQQHISTTFRINDSQQFSILLHSNDPDSVHISHIRIESNADKALYYTTCCIAAIAVILVLLILHLHDITLRGNITFFGILLITLASSLPLFVEYLYCGHDLGFHLMRIEGIRAGLSSGVFPIRLQPVWVNGYGYASSIMYGDTFLYIPAILRMLGFPIQTAYKCYIFLINLATSAIAYYCVNRIFHNRSIGLLGSLLYTLSIYRFTNIYVRSAVGEYSAMTFLPLIFCGLYLILKENAQQTDRKQGIALSVIGYSGIILTHTLTCEMAGGFTILVCILLCKRVFHKDTFLALLQVVIYTALLNLWWLVPFIDYLDEPLKINLMEQPYIQARGLLPAQIFAPFSSSIGISWDVALGLKGEMALNIGMGFTLGLVIMIAVFLIGKRLNSSPYRKLILISMGCGVWALFMTTAYFPYDKLMDYRMFFNRTLGALQMPWRLLTIAVLFFTFGTCSLIPILHEHYSSFYTKAAFCLICSGAVLSFCYEVSSYIENMSPYCIYDIGDLDTDAVISGEYMPGADIDTSLLDENIFTCDQDVHVANYNKQYLRIDADMINSSDSSHYVEAPLLYYNGYTATDVHSAQPLEVMSGNNGQLRIILPAQYTGTVHIEFQEPLYWKLSEWISLIFFLLLVILYCRAHIYTQKNRH